MEVFEEHNLWKANGLGTTEKQQEFIHNVFIFARKAYRTFYRVECI